MRRYLIRLLLVALLLAIGHVVHRQLDRIEAEAGAPVTFQLQLPLPPSIMHKYKLSPPLEIAEVYIAGHFNNWNPAHRAYRMRRVDNKTWAITLALEPGRHPYKYVIHLKDTSRLPAFARGHVWSQDPQATQSEDDAYGGYNSVHSVNSVRGLQRFIDMVLLLVGLGIVGYSLLEPLLHFLMHRPISLRFKLLLVFVLLLSASSVLFLWFTHNQQANLIKTLMRDRINMLHAFLLSRGADFSLLRTPAEQTRLEKMLRTFLQAAAVRFNYNTWSNTKQQFDNILLLDFQGNLLCYALGKGSEEFQLRRFHEDRRLVVRYYQDGTDAVYTHYTNTRRSKRGLFSCNWGDHSPFDIEDNFYNNPEWARKVRFFRHDCFIYPIHANLRPVGYYLIRINPQSFSLLLGQIMGQNLALLLTLVLFFSILLGRVSLLILRPLTSLSRGMDQVRQGNLEYQLQIKSRDEIQRLGEAYNYMRERLLASRRQVAHYTGHLEELVDVRTGELTHRNRVLEQELALARDIQQALLPDAVPDGDYYRISAACHPLEKVGGDLYDFHHYSKGRVGVFICDVSGHGVPAALISSMIKVHFLNLAPGVEHPDQLLRDMNRALSGRLPNHFLTAFYAILDPVSLELQFAGAGHLPQVLLRDQRQITELESNGTLLGVWKKSSYDYDRIQLRPGDRLVLFTDGAADCRPAGLNEGIRPHLLGRKRFYELLCDQQDKPGPRALQAVLNALFDHCGEAGCGDDLTLVMLDIVDGERG